MSFQDPSPPASPRYYDLDALRAFVMFLGVLLHASLFLLPGAPWPALDAAAPEASTFYGTLTSVIHGFRMPLFFLLSGYFSAMLWQRRGLRPLAAQRLKRVGVPLAAGCVTIMPAIAVISIVAHPGDTELFALWALPLIALFNMGHLWFLWYLLLIVGGFVILARLGLRFHHPLIWWLAIPLTLALQFLMKEPVFGADNSFGVYVPAIKTELSLLPNPTLLGYYALYFLFGAFFYRRSFTIRRWWTAALLPAALAFLVGMHFLYANPAEPQLLASAPFQTAYAWLMCFGMLGLFRWSFAGRNFWVRYFSDASYWIYLAHVPLVMVGHLLVIDLSIHYHLKFLMVCIGATLILLGSYQLVVRYTIIGRTLNGPRARRASGDGDGPNRSIPVADSG